jgi:flagellar biosynthesis protein FlhF
MKIHRYVAKDMRQALKQVREQQGPDAVILSSRRLGDEVEVVAAIDFDPEVHQAAAASGELDVYAAEASDTHDFAYLLNRSLNAGAQDTDTYVPGAATHPGMSEELSALRRMLETQLAALAWNDLTRRAPMHTEVLKELTKIGVIPDLAAEFVAQLPARCELVEAQRLALALFAHRIPVQPERWIGTGGMVALIGATGVGKTSTLAKLAARWVLRHGVHEVALVSADCVRIGAQDQLQTIGRLLGVPCFSVDNPAQLNALLADLQNRKMVFIDTPGFSQRDQRLADELTTLAVAHPRLETTLVLPANSQAGALEETLVRFAPAQPASCILTKLDEAASIGGALSALIRAELSLTYICDGQRLAEDIKPARAHQLVVRALQLSRSNGAAADEDLLSRRFGGISHALA